MDTSKWQIIYPSYINSMKKIPEGRRIKQTLAVEHPHPGEMAEICEFLQIPHVLEMNKAYPRDWLIRGRVRVMLKTPAGAFTHPEIHTKHDLMLKMGELIPKLKSRVNGISPAALQAAAESGQPPATKTAKKEEKKAEKKA